MNLAFTAVCLWCILMSLWIVAVYPSGDTRSCRDAYERARGNADAVRGTLAALQRTTTPRKGTR